MKENFMKPDFDDYELQDEYDLGKLPIMPKGRYAQPKFAVVKQTLVFQIVQLMREKNFSKTAMAKQLNTSLATLDKLLDPMNSAVTLQMLERVALVLGKQLRVEFV